MLEFNQTNLNFAGIIMGISYTLYFNWQSTPFSLSSTIAYSLPFLAFSGFLGFGISKIRKDNNYGIYFAVLSLLLLSI